MPPLGSPKPELRCALQLNENQSVAINTIVVVPWDAASVLEDPFDGGPDDPLCCGGRDQQLPPPELREPRDGDRRGDHLPCRDPSRIVKAETLADGLASVAWAQDTSRGGTGP
jgi:hypothetical protein